VRLLAAISCALALAACSQPVATPAPTPVNIEDSAQVRQVVRDYLVNDPELLKEALDALAERQSQARRVEIETDPRDVSVGPANAPIVIVEFFDYRCPYCHAAAEWLFQTMENRRDVRVVFKEFPVLGPESLEAARAAIASIPQGRYRQFHRALMAHRGDLGSPQIDTIARANGIDVARMRRDMANPEIDRILERNHELAVGENITGTPGFLINGELVPGFNRQQLEARLAEAAREVQQAQR